MNFTAKRKESRIFFQTAMIMVFAFLTGCVDKQDISNIPEGENVTLTVNVAEIVDHNQIMKPNARIADIAIGSLKSKDEGTSQIKFDGFEAIIGSSEEYMGISTKNTLPKSENKNNPDPTGRGKLASVMADGIKYRILLYSKVGGAFVKSVLATAGQSVEIDVVKDAKYLWYAYSYNTTDDIAIPANTNSPTIETPTDEALLYASGEISASVQNTPLLITFAHKLTQVLVEINTKQLYGDITAIDASFVSDSYFNKGTFDLKGGVVGTTTSYTTGPITFANLVQGSNDIKVARFYTANPTALNKFSMQIKSLTVQQINGETVQLIAPASPVDIEFGQYTPALGKILIGELKLFKTFPIKKMLHVSLNETYGYAAGQKASYNLIQDPRNFGTNASSLIKSAGFQHVLVRYAGELLTQLNAVQKPDIVLIAVYYTLSAAEQTALANYLANGGVVVLMSDNAGGSLEQASHRDFLRTVFNAPSIALTLSNVPGAVYALSNDNDKILNGPFGDIRGKHWGEDASFTMRATGIPASDITTYSEATAINSTTNLSGITMFKHKTLNLFWIADGGFLSNEYQNGTYPSYTIEPFATNSQNFPISKKYGNPGNGHASGSMDVYNSVIFANVMAWAVERAEFYGINTP